MAARSPPPAFSQLSKKTYANQAIWFLNGFWAGGMNNEAENIWGFCQEFIKLDGKKGADGNELDEFASHKFLESLQQTMTVMEMRKALREIDTDANGHMSLMEYLVHRYQKGLEETASSPQGTVNQAEVDKAQALFDEVSVALQAQIAAVESLNKAVAELEQAIAELDAAVAKTKKAVAELQAAEAQLATAEAELSAAIAGLKAEEDAYHGAIAKAEAIINDEGASTVKRSKAANELAQLKGEDPLPLRRAKITQEAALRKVQKEQAKVATARGAMEAVQAEQEAKQAETEVKKAEQEEAKAAAEAQAAELEARLAEASAKLEELRAAEGTPEGFIWWMSKTEMEADKFLPPSKQKYKHAKVDITAAHRTAK